MKCAKCGAEIRPGCVYCSNCGQEAQIVTEINILEDDLLRSMLDEESEKTKETVSAEDKCRKSSESSDTKQAERGRKQKKRQTAEEKAAAYADHSVDSACSCLSDSGRDTAVSAGKFCCVSVETRAGGF